MVIDHELRHLRRREGVVSDLRLRIDQANQVARMVFDAGHRLDGQVQHAQHGLVFRAADDSAVRRRRAQAGALREQIGEAARARHGIRVRIVVGQDQGAVMRLGDLEQLAKAVALEELI